MCQTGYNHPGECVKGLGGLGHTFARPPAKSFMDIDFYVYGYLRATNNSLYYVGKGKEDRAFVKRGRKIKPPKDKNKIVFLRKGLTEEKAFEWERFYIKRYGRKDNGTGILRNLTDGGEGASNPGEKTRQKLKKSAERLHSEKDELGRSVQGLKNAERLNAKKDKSGRSENAVKGGKEAHVEKDDNGKSKNAVKASKKAHVKRTEDGKSMLGVKNGKRINEEKDEFGRSKNAMNGGKTTHKEKDEFGRSVRGVQYAERLHEEKDELGRSVVAVRAATKAHSSRDGAGRSIAGVRGAAAIHSCRWEDPDHPELGQKPPGVLAQIQRRLGLPHGPENRRRVYLEVRETKLETALERKM